MSVDQSRCERYVIFLDIDGVLLPVPRFTFGGGDLSPECVVLLQRLVDALGGSAKVTIVLSSTWRNSPLMIERLNAFFAKVAGEGLPTVTDGTPNGTVIVSQVDYYADDPTEQRLVRDRVDEIMRWLHTHIESHPEAIGGRWFAIDDMKLDVDTRMHGHFLHTETEVGMTQDDMVRAVAMAQSLPTPEEAHAAALRALVDPALKDEEIAIARVQKERLERDVVDLQAQLEAAQNRIAELSATTRAQEKDLRDTERRLEEVSYRMAVVDFAKRDDTLRAAVDAASRQTGKDRKETDDRIKAYVTLLRARKELEKKVRAQAKKQKGAVA